VLAAPWAACRICGELYQTDLDRLVYKLLLNNEPDYLATYEEAKRQREEWRFEHEGLYHTEEQIRELELANPPKVMTEEAAIALEEYGIGVPFT